MCTHLLLNPRMCHKKNTAGRAYSCLPLLHDESLFVVKSKSHTFPPSCRSLGISLPSVMSMVHLTESCSMQKRVSWKESLRSFTCLSLAGRSANTELSSTQPSRIRTGACNFNQFHWLCRGRARYLTLTMGGMQARKSSALKREVPNLQVVADSSWETCKQFSTLNIDSEVFGMLLSRSLVCWTALFLLKSPSDSEGRLLGLYKDSSLPVPLCIFLDLRRYAKCWSVTHLWDLDIPEQLRQTVWAEDCREIVFELLLKKNCRFRITKAGSTGIQWSSIMEPGQETNLG